MESKPSIPSVDQARLDFDREKWRAEENLRREDLGLKRDELNRSRWINPLVIAVFAAAAAAFGNAGVTLINSYQQSNLERERSTATQGLNSAQARDTLKLEQTKSEAARILEVVKTNDPDKAAVNLKFLIETGLIADDDTRKKIQAYLDKREPGRGVSLPALIAPRAAVPMGAGEVKCSIPSTYAPDKIREAIVAALALEPLALALKRKSSALSVFDNFGHKSSIFPGYYESSVADAGLVKQSDGSYTVIVSMSFTISSQDTANIESYREPSDIQRLTYSTEAAKQLREKLTVSFDSGVSCSPEQRN